MDDFFKLIGISVAGLIGFAIFITGSLLNTYYGGFVLGELWQWFMIPAGAPVLPQRTAIGAFLLVGLMTMSLTVVLTYRTTPSEKLSGWGRSVAMLIAGTVGITASWLLGMFWNWWLG